MNPLVKSIAHTARTVIRSSGLDIVRYPGHKTTVQGQRARLMQHLGISLVFDVGANVGQFGEELRLFGYQGQILSFEPQLAAYRQLQAAAAADPKWHAYHHAFGDADGQSTINLSQNSFSSSLLPLLPSHLESAPEAAYVGQETIEVRSLSSFWREHGAQYAGHALMLKMDTQGFERYVLAGAAEFLPHVALIELEMSLVELYNGEMLYQEMTAYLDSLGFGTLLALIPGHSNPETGRLLQFDGIFGH